GHARRREHRPQRERHAPRDPRGLHRRRHARQGRLSAASAARPGGRGEAANGEGEPAMAQLLSALAMQQIGLGAIEYAMFAAITAIMVMFVVETVNKYT